METPLRELVANLKRENIPFFFLREDPAFDEFEHDAFVPKIKIASARPILETLGWRQFGGGSRLYNLLKHDRLHEQWYYIDVERTSILKLDIIVQFRFKYENCYYEYSPDWSKLNGELIQRLNPSEELDLLILHLALEKRFVSEKNAILFRKLISEVENIGNSISTCYANIPRSFRSSDSIPNNCIGLILGRSMRVNRISDRNVLPNILRKLLLRICFRKTVTLIFIGIDGSGKSTIAQKVAQTFSALTDLKYGGFKDHQSKFLNQLNAYRSGKERGKICTLILRLIYHSWYAALISLDKFKSNEVIIYDRHPYFDILLEQKKNIRTNLPMSFIQMLYRLSVRKKRTLIMFCIGEPEVLNARKGERSIREIESYNSIVKSFFESDASEQKSFALLDTSGDLESTLNEAMKGIMVFFQRELKLA